MAIITITKRTSDGVPMFDTINAGDLSKYERLGWRRHTSHHL